MSHITSQENSQYVLVEAREDRGRGGSTAYGRHVAVGNQVVARWDALGAIADSEASNRGSQTELELAEMQADLLRRKSS